MNASKEIAKEIIEEFVEKGANLEHKRWAGWQKYMFSKCEQNKKGELIVPSWAVKRWWRQIETKYKDLSEQEKESDRKETRNYLPLLKQALSTQKQQILTLIKEKNKSKNYDDIIKAIEERI